MDSTAARGGAVMTEAGGGRDPGASSLSCPAPTKAPAPPREGCLLGHVPLSLGPSASRFRGSPLQLHFSAEHGRDLQKDRVFLPRCPFLLICTGHRPRRGSTCCLS